jgi:Mrp family chromosome partitioning ATPase
MVELLENLASTYDIVLLDSPLVLPVTDAAVLSNWPAARWSSSAPTAFTGRSCSRRWSYTTRWTRTSSASS